MASGIVPAFPIPGTPTTSTVRANFLSARDEIGALQASLSTNGFHLTAADTAGLGTAQGGVQDGRIAFDTDKVVLVRDTLAGGMLPAYWLDLAQRTIPYGTTGARPPAGSITDGSFAEFYWNTTTSKFQLDNGAVWVDIGPGGGGGPVLTENIVTSFTIGDNSVTHPAIPLTGAGSGAIRFSVLANVDGTAHAGQPNFDTVENLQGAALNWISDSGAGGHFDGAPDARVSAYCWITIGGFSYTIMALTPPGTGFNEVTLDASVSDGTVDFIQGVYSYGAWIENTTDPGGTQFAVFPTVEYATESTANIISPVEVATMAILMGIRCYTAFNVVEKFTGFGGAGTFNQGNWIYVGANWGAATKTGEILKVVGTTTDPVIWYRLLTGADFADLDAVVEWDGASDGATCTAGTPDIAGLSRMALSLDGAVTWIAFNGSAWVTTSLANLENEGMEVPAGYGSGSLRDVNGATIPADDGTGSPPAGWGTLRLAMAAAGVGLDFRMAGGVRAPSVDNNGTIYNVYFDWGETDLTCPMTIGLVNQDFMVERTSTTSAKFTRTMGTNSIRQVHFQVWT